MSFFGGLIAFAFGAILRLLFGAVSMAYNVIIVLANVDLFGFNSPDAANSLLHTITERIYILLGIFMLFRVGFSMLQYIISPDKMTDKQAGIGNIIKRTIISLLILVLFQPALSWLMTFQNKIISSNVLGTVILGVRSDSVVDEEKNLGDSLPSTVIQSMTSVSEEWDENTDEKGVCKDKSTWTEIIEDNGKCKEKIEDGLDSKYALEEMVKPENWQRWFDVEITTKGTGAGLESATFQSNFLLLAIVAIVILWCLFSLGLQLGVRIIKLGFLALIAPIPIISYIEPSQGKNGMLGKWAKEFAKTYLMLFIRLAALYFAVLVIILVGNVIGSEVLNYEGDVVSDNILVIGQVKIIVIIAAFLFADQVPKMIENIFGLKMDGSMFKNPFKQMRESKSLMGTVGGAVGAGLGAARALPQLKKLTSQAKNVSSGLNTKFGTGFSKDKLRAGMKAYGNLAHKAGANVANIGRSAQRTAKDLQENKQGFMEGIVDSQTKAAEEGYNRASRVGTSMTDKLLGKQFPLKEEKEKAGIQAKSANGIVNDAESDTEKKNNNFKSEKLRAEGLKSSYKAAQENGKDTEIIEAENAVAMAKKHLQQEVDAKTQKVQEKASATSQYQLNESRLRKIDSELQEARTRGLPQATIDTLNREKAKITLDNQQLLQNIDSINTDIQQISGRISSGQVAVTNAEQTLVTANAGFNDRMEKQRMEINAADKKLDDYKKAYTSEKIKQRVTDYDKIYKAYEDAMNSGVIGKDTSFEAYFDSARGKDEATRLNIEIDNDFRKFAEQLTTLSRQGFDYKAEIEKKEEDAKAALDAISKMAKDAKAEGKSAEEIKALIEKEKAKYFFTVEEKSTDANGNIITKTKDIIKYRDVFKDLADRSEVEEQRLGREIEEIEKGTRGMGVVNEVVNFGDFGNGPGPGPGGPPPGA